MNDITCRKQITRSDTRYPTTEELYAGSLVIVHSQFNLYKGFLWVYNGKHAQGCQIFVFCFKKKKALQSAMTLMENKNLTPLRMFTIVYPQKPLIKIKLAVDNYRTPCP